MIESLLGRTETDIKKFEALFGEDELNNEISPRNDFSSRQVDLCESLERIVYPAMAKSINDKWHLLPNNNKYKQGIRVELCL